MRRKKKVSLVWFQIEVDHPLSEGCIQVRLPPLSALFWLLETIIRRVFIHLWFWIAGKHVASLSDVELNGVFLDEIQVVILLRRGGGGVGRVLVMHTVSCEQKYYGVQARIGQIAVHCQQRSLACLFKDRIDFD